VAFIAAFAFIRFSVRMIRAQVKWWPGNVTPGGVHIHHAVFGLVFMCVGGVGGLAVQDNDSGWAAVAAALLGIGMALLAVLGWVPAGFDPGPAGRVAAYLGIILTLIVNLLFTAVCLLKGKVWCGVLGVYIGLIALIGAIRLARPGSPGPHRGPPGSPHLNQGPG
jgi:drug/metabolite transporter superfamily protein YnfA